MRSDDAVETFKRHAEYEPGAASGRHGEYCSCNRTEPGAIRWYFDIKII